MQDLGMKCVVAESVPHFLLPAQKEHLAAVANDLIQIATSEPDFLKEAIAGDELWVPTLNRMEASLSYIQCFLHLVSSTNVYLFHRTWLDTFWTDLICLLS